MVEQIRNIQKDYENYLDACKITKKNRKKELAKLERLKSLNEENGIDTTPILDKIENAKNEFNEVDREIGKVKKVIFRLGVCINIMENKESIEEGFQTEQVFDPNC